MCMTRGRIQKSRSPGHRWRAEDYDDEGNLKAPFWMWVGVAWMLLPWWLMAAGIAANDTLRVAEILYPDMADMVTGLIVSLPGFLLCAVYPLRGRRPRWSLGVYGAAFAGLALEIMRLGSVMLRLTDLEMATRGDLLLSVMCVDFAVLLGMVMTPRLWTVFGWLEVKS